MQKEANAPVLGGPPIAGTTPLMGAKKIRHEEQQQQQQQQVGDESPPRSPRSPRSPRFQISSSVGAAAPTFTPPNANRVLASSEGEVNRSPRAHTREVAPKVPREAPRPAARSESKSPSKGNPRKQMPPLDMSKGTVKQPSIPAPKPPPRSPKIIDDSAGTQNMSFCFFFALLISFVLFFALATPPLSPKPVPSPRRVVKANAEMDNKDTPPVSPRTSPRPPARKESSATPSLPSLPPNSEETPVDNVNSNEQNDEEDDSMPEECHIVYLELQDLIDEWELADDAKG